MDIMVCNELVWFGAGFGAALVLAAFAVSFFLRPAVYNVDHWKLNARLPLTSSLWMNMGYWKTPLDESIDKFDEACQRLLEEVFLTAGVLPLKDEKSGRAREPVALLDLGIGCGDQTKAILRLFSNAGRDLHYVGLTNNEDQSNFASDVVMKAAHETQFSGPLRVFLADAAKPWLWKPEISSSIELLKDKNAERWVLGLDSFYHFKPSRMPIFRYAATELDASVMAFDLILSDTATISQRLLARSIGMATQCPWRAFKTSTAYRAQLVEAGFDPGQIEIRDVTAQVFPGLIRFIDGQAKYLAAFGISMRSYKGFRNVLNWFVRSNAIKAVIVVARRS